MASTEDDHITRLEDFILELDDICEQGKQALENNDEVTAQKLMQRANQMSIEMLCQLGKQNEKIDTAENRRCFQPNHIQVGVSAEIKDDLKRQATELDDLTTFKKQIFQRLQATYEKMRRDLDPVRKKVTTSKREVESNDAVHSLSQDHSNEQRVSTSTEMNHDSSHLLWNNPREFFEEECEPWWLAKERYPPLWLGTDGFEEMTEQWLSNDENGRQKLAFLEAGGIFVLSGLNTTHAMLSRPPKFTCACGTECWMPNTDDSSEQRSPDDFTTREEQALSADFETCVVDNMENALCCCGHELEQGPAGVPNGEADTEALQDAERVKDKSTSQEFEGRQFENPYVTLRYIVKKADGTAETVEQVLSTVEKNADGSFSCFNNLDTLGEVLKDIKGRITFYPEFIRCEEPWLDQIPIYRDKKRQNPWVVFDHAVKNIHNDERKLNREILCPDHFMRSSFGPIRGISKEAQRLSNGMWATNWVDRMSDGSVRCTTEIRQLPDRGWWL
ncbi:hypothetical protein L207DRAFT_586529 [Hyaloscypha variabilis F]|uniref:Uncharacterized protein n=1 Tax=Hyaloscypha variabilis (strain UAMH 11265 / GT02V1 / F) TaxID=1149755 RepID=A0A2J6RE96_HYAVF|nr:hypothetical protein L207DRAFT_586529 [Hyaloscypha variabilis F]